MHAQAHAHAHVHTRALHAPHAPHCTHRAHAHTHCTHRMRTHAHLPMHARTLLQGDFVVHFFGLELCHYDEHWHPTRGACVHVHVCVRACMCTRAFMHGHAQCMCACVHVRVCLHARAHARMASLMCVYMRSGSIFQMFGDSAAVVSAQYDETGRLL